MDCATEEWNGTNWSSVAQVSVPSRQGSGAGSVNSAVIFGDIVNRTSTYEYDGSSWSSGGSGHESRYGAGGGGTQNDAISFAGWAYPIPNAGNCTQTYDGTVWAASGDMTISVRQNLATQGNQGQAPNAFAVGGTGVPNNYIAMTCTEEYSGVSGGELSVGLLTADILKGDASGFSGSLDFSGMVSSSAQMAADISGSFATGMEISTNSVISASVVTLSLIHI